MQIVFKTNTVALVGGVQQHFAAGVHDVQPDEDAQKLVEDGDAQLPKGVTAEPSDAQSAAAQAAEAQRLADEAEAQRLADAEAAQAAAEAQAKADAEAAQAAAEAQAKADAEAAQAAADAQANAQAAAAAPAAKPVEKGGNKK